MKQNLKKQIKRETDPGKKARLTERLNVKASNNTAALKNKHLNSVDWKSLYNKDAVETNE